MNPEKEPERHVPYSPLPGGPREAEAPKSSLRSLVVPLTLAGALAAALGAGFLLTRGSAPRPVPTAEAPAALPALPVPAENRGLEGLTAPQAPQAPSPAPVETAAEAAVAKPAAGACRAFITVTNNAFQPYKYIDRCPLGTRAERTDWPKAGDCGCFSGKTPPGAAGRMGQ